jgi:hypothetical protein
MLLYFGFKLEDLDRWIGLQKINEERKLKQFSFSDFEDFIGGLN